MMRRMLLLHPRSRMDTNEASPPSQHPYQNYRAKETQREDSHDSDEENNLNQGNANKNDVSMDSSLASSIVYQQQHEAQQAQEEQRRYQVYPIPPSGVRSLVGGFVSLDGQSVEIPLSDVDDDNDSDYCSRPPPPSSSLVVPHDAPSVVADDHKSIRQVLPSSQDEEGMVLLELESQASSSATSRNRTSGARHVTRLPSRTPPPPLPPPPPIVVSVSSDVSSIHSSALYDNPFASSSSSSSSSLPKTKTTKTATTTTSLPTTLKIVGLPSARNTDDDKEQNNAVLLYRPTLPANGKCTVARPPSILRNPLPPTQQQQGKKSKKASSLLRVKTTTTTKTTTPAAATTTTPQTATSFLSTTSSFWSTPVKEVAFFQKKTNNIKNKKNNHKKKKQQQRRRDTTAYSPTESYDDIENDNDIKNNNDDECCCCRCCPHWMQRSPTWLKLLFVMSFFIFLASSALIAVAVTFAVRDGTRENESTNNNINNNNNNRFVDGNNPGKTPTSTTTTTTTTVAATPVSSPTQGLPDSDPTVPATAPATVPDSTVTTIATAEPSHFPTTLAPSISPTIPPVPIPSTLAPTPELDRTVLTFMVTAGTWDDTVDPALVLPRLPVRQRRAFMVHLGNWNNDPTCPTEQYTAVSQLYAQSSCPVYFVAGHNETNGCSNPNDALDEWRDALVDYHQQFWPRPPWTFWDDNWAGYPDAWVFDTNRIALCGLHLTAGSETNTGRRPSTQASLEWIETNYEFYRRNYRKMFILANAAVTDPVHAEFFATLFRRLREDYASMDFVWVQPAVGGNGTVSTPAYERAYQGIANLDVISVVPSIWPPMRIQVFSNNDIVIEQDQWFRNRTGLNV